MDYLALSSRRGDPLYLAIKPSLGPSSWRRAEYLDPVLLRGSADLLHVGRTRRREDYPLRRLAVGTHKVLMLGGG